MLGCDFHRTIVPTQGNNEGTQSKGRRDKNIPSSTLVVGDEVDAMKGEEGSETSFC